MVTSLMMSAKLATPGLLKNKILRNKGYDLIIPDYDVTNKILLREPNYIVDVVKWPKLSNSSISMREVIITSILFYFKTTFFEVWSWFKFSNLGLVLGMTLKLYTSVAKGLIKSQKVLWAKSYVCRSYRGKTGKGELFAHILPNLASKNDITNFVNNTDFDDKLKYLNKKVTSNKTKHLHVENELKKLERFGSIYFRGKNHFEDYCAQNYLVFQSIYRYF